MCVLVELSTSVENLTRLHRAYVRVGRTSRVKLLTGANKSSLCVGGVNATQKCQQLLTFI